MIVNKPNPAVFKKQSIEYLVQFFNLILEKEESWDHIEDEKSRLKLWCYHQGTLKNALTLLFLALENQLKSKICEVSPLLLLDQSPSDWNSIERDKKFHDFHLRPFDDLLALFIELGFGVMDGQVIQNFNQLRKKRNKIVHGVFNDNLSPKSLFSDFVLIVDNVWGAGIWWNQLKSYITDEPLFGSYDAKYEQAWLSHYIEFLIDLLGAKVTGRILGVNFTQRRYLCPFCHCYLNVPADNYFYRHAVLRPNEPQSKTLFCVVCDKKFEVLRKDCWYNECKGNVILFLKDSPYPDSEICLTCGGWDPSKAE